MFPLDVTIGQFWESLEGTIDRISLNSRNETRQKRKKAPS